MSFMIGRWETLARGAMVGLLAIAFLACGGGEAGDDGNPGGEPSTSGTEVPRPGEAPQRDAPSGSAPMPAEVSSFTARITGTRDTLYERSAAAKIEAATNCASDRPTRISFAVTDDEDLPTRFRAITGVVLEPGQTGSFRADTVTYWYPRFGLPSQTTYRGHGTLEITHHEASQDAPRLVGRIVGEDMRDSKGEAVEVEVNFDVGWSCGFEG